VGRVTIENHFKLSVTDMYIFGKNEGYIFRFDYSTSDNKQKFNLNTRNDSSDNISHKESNQFVNYIHNQNSSSNLSNLDLINKFKKDHPATINCIASDKDITLKIDKFFIPKSNNVFILDTKKMSYVMNPKNPNELKEAIKTDAIKKITMEPIIKDMSENSNSSENSEGQSNSNSIAYSENNENENLPSIRSFHIKRKANEEYYIVNISLIKLLIYDHEKDSIVEIKDGNKISQIEAKKHEDYKKKDPGYMNIRFSKFSPNDQYAEAVEEQEDINIKEGIIIKQIEYALSKEENQPTITRMKYISFFTFLIFISIPAFFLTLFLISYNVIIDNISLINNTFTLIYNTIYGIFHTRELILLNNPIYFNFYQPRTDYIKNNTDFLLNLFSSSHSLLSSIITTSLPISQNNYNLLYNTNISTYILEDDLNIKSINLKLSSAIIETNTALYHIAHQDISEIFPTAKDVFFFMYNSINNIYNMLFKQSNIFIEELSLNVEKYQMIFLYIFASVVGVCFISYFILVYSYMAVGKRKESYLEVFFEIGEGVIKNSLEKCEKFTKKFQSENNVNEDVSNLDEAEIINDTNTSLLANTKSSRNSSKKRKSNNSKEDKIIKIKILIGLLFISLFFFVLYFVYQNYLKIIKNYVEIYNNNCNEQAYFLVIFNVLREYFFEKNTKVFGKNVTEYMYQTIDDIYRFKLERENVFFIFYNFHRI